MDEQLIGIKRLLSGILLLMLFATIYFTKDILLPIVIGLLLSATLSPIVRALDRRGIARPVSAAVLVTGIALTIAFAVLVLGGSVAMWVDQAPRLGAELKYKLSSLTESLQAVQDASEQVETIAEFGGADIEKVVIEQPGLLNTAVSNMAGFITSVIVGMVLTLFFLASGNLFVVKLVQSFSTLKDKKRAVRIVSDIQLRVSRYLLAITLINAGLGSAIALALYLLEVPFWWIWGAAAFALNFLPFLGAMAGVVLVAAYSVVTFDSLYYAALPPLAYLFLTSLEGQIITPHLLGRKLELNTVSVFLTVVFWGWLWGVPGALMAVPFLVCLKVICDHVDELQWFGNFLSSRATPPKANGEPTGEEQPSPG